MPEIQMNPVESSAVSHVGYDPDTKTMRVRYSSGAVYDFPDTEAADHQGLLSSDSIGKHLNKHFRARGRRVS